MTNKISCFRLLNITPRLINTELKQNMDDIKLEERKETKLYKKRFLLCGDHFFFRK